MEYVQFRMERDETKGKCTNFPNDKGGSYDGHRISGTYYTC